MFRHLHFLVFHVFFFFSSHENGERIFFCHFTTYMARIYLSFFPHLIKVISCFLVKFFFAFIMFCFDGFKFEIGKERHFLYHFLFLFYVWYGNLYHNVLYNSVSTFIWFRIIIFNFFNHFSLTSYN